MWVSGVLLVGLLGGPQVTPRRIALPFGRAAVGGDVPAALRDRELVNFGGPFVGGAGRVVPVHRALMCGLVPFAGADGVLGGPLDVLLRNGLPGGEFRAPAQQLLRPLGGLLTR
ncbi:Mycobacterium terramassiliense ORFan [Mycobacterium terramassiliense]|uniref:Mycobacterium terramassiliense ORFan n=1 Tax=Mycobacterium terramassiliense TaxID=1841859 RepID=A0A2U3NC02_9MYCO|nr:Mycobacterium terramassiliense ORFan [Mycobacterium terramassiliense]